MSLSDLFVPVIMKITVFCFIFFFNAVLLILKNHMGGYFVTFDYRGKPGSLLLCRCRAAVGITWEQGAGLLHLSPPPSRLSREKGSQLWGDLKEMLSKPFHPITYSGGPRISPRAYTVSSCFRKHSCIPPIKTLWKLLL